MTLPNNEKVPMMKKVNIFTLQMSQWRIVKDEPFSLMDVTFMSKNKDYKKLFAPPTFNLVRDFKAGKISKGMYLKRYRAHIYKTSRDYRDLWLEALDQKNLVLMCFCKNPSECHRTYLKEYMIEFARENGFEVGLSGEITKDNVETLINEIN